MNRFNEDAPSNLEFLAHLYGEELPCNEPILIQCDSCGQYVDADETQPIDDGTDTALICCAECAAIPQEEECTCVQTDVDQVDARECAAHNGTQGKPWPPERLIPVSTPRKPVATETCPYCHSGSLGSIGPLAECRNCHQVWNPAIAEVS